MKRETVFIDGDGEQTRDFTFVENAVQANIKAMLTPNNEVAGNIFNIAVGKNFSVNTLYNNIQKTTGQRPRRHLPRNPQRRHPQLALPTYPKPKN